MGAEELNQIARDLQNGEISRKQCKARLNQHAQNWFPHTWKPSVR